MCRKQYIIMKIKCFILLIVLGVYSCKTNETNDVLNLAIDDQYQQYEDLKLSEAYVDLMDPRNSDKADPEKVYASWSNFHQQIGNILAKENFSWGTDEPIIRMQNKVYFNKEGKVEHYAFFIGTSSVTEEKQKEFGEIVQKHLSEIKINLERKEQFAQCGRISYKNS